MEEAEQDLFSKMLQEWQSNRLVAIPTETVYGLAAPIHRPQLIQKIFNLKKRPFHDPLIIHAADLKDFEPYILPSFLKTTEWTLVQKLFLKFAPGPLTVLVPRNPETLSPLITAQSEWVAIRIPHHPLTLSLLKQLKIPLCAPSANPFTKTSPTLASHVRSYFSSEDVFVIDGGACERGIESTIIKILSLQTLSTDQYLPSPNSKTLFPNLAIQILRPGHITTEDLKKFANILPYDFSINEEKKYTHEKIQKEYHVPGSASVHYCPPMPLCLSQHNVDVLIKKQHPQFLKFLEITKFSPNSADVISLPHDASLCAKDLYKTLLSPLDSKYQFRFLILPIHSILEADPLWKSIFNRLERATTWNFIS
jgi:L-threonylcarbamoyladenylate synthase